MAVIRTVCAVVSTLALVIVAACAVTLANPPATYTVAPCSLWADTSSPVLPPHTILNECARPDGTIDHAPSD
jgi:hypothetical protein